MYDEFYLNSPNATYYLRGRGYRAEEFQRVVSEVSGIRFDDFFTRHVRGVDVLPYDEALSYVGLHLVQQRESEHYSGITVNVGTPGSAIIGNVINGSAAEDAGLQPGDEILTIDGKKVMNKDWLSTLNRFKQGDRAPISFKRDRRTLRTTLVLGAMDRFEYRIEEMKDATVGQKALRAAWLKGE